jgi:hypothetical protein
VRTDAEIAALPAGRCACIGVAGEHDRATTPGCLLAPMKIWKVEEKRFQRWSLTVPAKSAAEAIRAARLCGLVEPATATEVV